MLKKEAFLLAYTHARFESYFLRVSRYGSNVNTVLNPKCNTVAYQEAVLLCSVTNMPLLWRAAVVNLRTVSLDFIYFTLSFVPVRESPMYVTL